MKTVGFDIAQVAWVQFSPIPGEPGHVFLSAFGTIQSADGATISVPISGWEGLTEEAREAVEAALREIFFQTAANAIDLQSGESLTMIANGLLRQAGPNDVVVWTKP